MWKLGQVKVWTVHQVVAYNFRRARNEEGWTQAQTGEMLEQQLRSEFTSAEHITKDTLASLLRWQASKATERPPGLDPRTVNYIHTIVHSAFKDAVTATFLRRVESSDVDRITLHGLRHTWATLALEKGIHRRVVQERSVTRRSPSPSASTPRAPTLHDEAAELVSAFVLG